MRVLGLEKEVTQKQSGRGQGKLRVMGEVGVVCESRGVGTRAAAYALVGGHAHLVGWHPNPR